MKATDYIVRFLIDRGVKDIFGYPGGVICHLMDSAQKYANEIAAHIHYHEQAAAFAGCAYAQTKSLATAVYATSGPGAVNLMTGVANAYFDSIPLIFFTGQVDTYALRPFAELRQYGFQETDIVSMAKGITKYCKRIDDAKTLPDELERAWQIAHEGRPGPVLLDLPADVQRSDIKVVLASAPDVANPGNVSYAATTILQSLQQAKRPCLLLGGGIKSIGLVDQARSLIHQWNIPTVFSLPAFDILPWNDPLNLGFIGANGHRSANFAVAKCDLLITLGTRLDLKQVGNTRSKFAPQARILRVDIDQTELKCSIHPNVEALQVDLKPLLPLLLEGEIESTQEDNWQHWRNICTELIQRIKEADCKDIQHQCISALSDRISTCGGITIDVGQHMLWTAQALKIQQGQRVCMSAGLGSMGYSLPASIGLYYAIHRPVVCVNGDGGLQMNLQELQFIKRERLPITVVVMNNHALGMIRQFQEENFMNNYMQTTLMSGYSAPDFERIAYAYEIPYYRITSPKDLSSFSLSESGPAFLDVMLPEQTYLLPKFNAKSVLHDQIPALDRAEFEYLEHLS